MINMISCLLIACMFLCIGKFIFGVQEHDWSNIDFIGMLFLPNISLLTYLLTYLLSLLLAFLCFMRLWYALVIFEWYVNFPKPKLTCFTLPLQLWLAFFLFKRFFKELLALLLSTVSIILLGKTRVTKICISFCLLSDCMF